MLRVHLLLWSRVLSLSLLVVQPVLVVVVGACLPDPVCTATARASLFAGLFH